MATEMRRRTVVIADDSRAMRVALGVLLQKTEFHVVGEAGDGIQAIQRCIALHPDVLLLDLDMPRLNGLQVIADVRKGSPTTKIVVCTGYSAPELADYALRHAASAYVLKDELRERLIPELRTVMRSV